jgi:hypothetical protein
MRCAGYLRLSYVHLLPDADGKMVAAVMGEML